jgi:hypothetical protein
MRDGQTGHWQARVVASSVRESVYVPIGFQPLCAYHMELPGPASNVINAQSSLRPSPDPQLVNMKTPPTSLPVFPTLILCM